MKKLFMAFAVVTLLLWIQVTDVFAVNENCEARIGSTYYSTLENAVTAARHGDTVVILSDVVLDATLVIDKGITLTTDGNTDRTISGTPSSNNYLINVKTLASSICGTGPNSRLIVDGGNVTHSRALVCLQAADSQMKYVTLQNNISTYSGGAGLYTNKTGIIVEDCIICNNRCMGTTGGGGVYLTGTANVTMQRCTISNNSAIASGGGFFVATNGELSADRCTITGNNALVRGGAGKVNGQFHPTGCTIYDNTAPSDGSSSMLVALPVFQGNLLGYVDGSDGQQEAVYRLTENGDTYSTYTAKLLSSGFTLCRTTEIDENTYGVFTNGSKTVTLMDTPSLKNGTVRIVIENTAILPNLDSPAGATSNEPTVSMLGTGTPTSQNGMCFIYQLSDGRFVLVDGGYPDDADQIYQTLSTLAGNEDVTIAAWFLSHAHNDHVAAFESFWESDYSTHVTLEKVVYNFPGTRTFEDNIITKAQSQSWMNRVVAVINQFPSSVERIKAHPGQVYNIGDATITMLYSAELLSPDEVWNFNDSSLIFSIELGGTKFLQLADCAREAGSVLTATYDSQLESDVLQVAHHGHYNNSVSSSLYNSVSANYAFWPSTEERYNWEENRNAEANIWLFNRQQSGNLTMWCAGNLIRTFQIHDGQLSALPVARIDSIYFETLDEAVMEAQDGSVITLIRPCVIRNGGVLVDKNLTLRTDAENPCYINGAVFVQDGKTLTLSGEISVKEISLGTSALLNFDGTICQDIITSLNIGSFADVKNAQTNRMTFLTGNVAENYQKITLINNTNPNDITEKYMLYADGRVIKAGEAKVGNTVYPTLEQAVASASTDARITIIADVHLTEQLKIQRNLTLVTDGICDRTITSDYTDGYALFVTGSSGAHVNVQMQGSSNSRLIIDGEGRSRSKSLVCSNYATTSLSNVVICNSNSTFTGAGLYVTQGNANLSNCELSANVTSDRGGAAYVTSTGSLSLNACQITNNQASYGGGIYGANSSSGLSATITIFSSLMEDNVASNRGGGIYGNGDNVSCCNVAVQGTVFRRNSANIASNGAGGAICLVGPRANVTVIESTFENNSASAFGGAITTSSASGNVTLNSCTFTANAVGGSSLGGGAVCCGTLSVAGGTTSMSENETMTANGGAICLQNTTLTIENNAILLLYHNVAYNGYGNDISLPENGAIVLNGDVEDMADFYIANASVGDIVLTGNNVIQSYEKFIFREGFLAVASDGTLVSP